MIFVELEGLDVTRVTFGSNGIHTRFVRLAGIVRTSFSDEPYLFSAHLQEDGALEFKEDRHAQKYTHCKEPCVCCVSRKRSLEACGAVGFGPCEVVWGSGFSQTGGGPGHPGHRDSLFFARVREAKSP